ncbi:MAG: dihydropteroate synthase [Saprospiraceae bacterium]|nr:dihydropteroate synthase [Saprospiraceae bacterium]
MTRFRLLDLTRPVVMGILNVTPDSFFDGGRYTTIDDVLHQAEKMLQAGAVLLDIGGASSRPGATEITEDEELKRVLPAIEALTKHFPEALLSIDTWRGQVALSAVEAGAHIINDISAGRLDAAMYPTLKAIHEDRQLGPVPYILMHMQGRPATMQQAPVYTDVVTEVLDFFIAEVGRLRALGVTDIILDPGFGFGKTVEQNYQLLRQLSTFSQVLGLPVLAGLSRKSMICKVLKVNPEHALNGTTALHIVALQQGAKILRVHDVREAVEVIRLWEMLASF